MMASVKILAGYFALLVIAFGGAMLAGAAGVVLWSLARPHWGFFAFVAGLLGLIGWSLRAKDD